MALQGPFVVVADSPASDVVAVLRADGAYPIIETSWADAATALVTVEPEGVVLAEPVADERAAPFAAAIEERYCNGTGAFIPIVARIGDDAPPPALDALAIGIDAPAERIARRLSSALRVRSLHGTVLRRIETLQSNGQQPPELSPTDPLEDASVLVAGRGRSYPELSVAVGAQAAVIGALSVESAARALNARDIDGVVIGDGFGPRIIEALLTVMAEDSRFRDLPVAVLGGSATAIEPFYLQLPNLERSADAPGRLVERFLPFVRVRAFGQRLHRMLQSLDAEGMLDPDTGLLSKEAFWRDLNRAVADAENRSVRLSIARFAFEQDDRRISLDAARLLARLMRRVDFACREADSSIFAVFTETDLRAAHVITRRLASVLRNTMLAPDHGHRGVDAAITLATLKPTDNIDSLIARVTGHSLAS